VLARTASLWQGGEETSSAGRTATGWRPPPRGLPVLEAALQDLHPAASNLTSGEVLRLSASIPLRTLVGMAGAANPVSYIDDLLASVG